ncbi:ankyrin repeat-containing domain protein [Trichoderma sp. SZMC 28012]
MAAQAVPKTRTHDDYTVGWVCALSKEQTAATAMLDERHNNLSTPPNDPNTYTLGSIGQHNIVIACLPEGEIGTSSAATFATWMISTFPSIKFGLMVGIGGGIYPKVRLGDVVVSAPTGRYPGVVQWDYGKAEKGGEFKQIGSLNNPPALLRTALTKLRTENELSGSKIPEYLDELSQRWPRLVSRYTWSESLKDPLHNPAADGYETKPRETRVHYGLIASGNQVIKDAEFRDRLDQRYDGNVLCIEMEAAGLMNNFPCIVIRGICDYADSQKNNDWQEYAAAVAAAFAKELLHYIQPRDVDGERLVRDIITDVYNDVTHIKSKLDRKDDVEILDWLTRTDYGPQQSDYLNRRQPETGTWFLKSVEFQDWLATGKQTLFCPGIPGAGKTILTSVVVDYLCSKFYNNSKIGIAYIYCNFKKQEEQRLHNLLASVLKQLAESQPYLPHSIKSLYNRHKDKRTNPSTNEILTVLQSVASIFSRIFIIVDALDECQESSGCRASFISELSNLQMRNGVNIFATSRFIPDIRDRFKGSQEVEIRAHDEDVRKYLKSQIMQFGSALLKARCEEVTTEITKVVKGIIQVLDSDSEELAWLVLSWITCAKRPLATKELQHALAVEVGKTELDEENLVQIEDMVSVCAGLVTIDEESEVIRLVHYTTQEYFERTQNRWFPTAQAKITTVCVTYLSFNAFETGKCETHEKFEERLQLFPFFNYAASNWGHHAPKDKVTQEVTKFLNSQAKVEASSQALVAARTRLGDDTPRKMTGLHLAGFFGLNNAADTLLQLGHSPIEADTLNRQPLWYAAQNGHEAIITLLITRGAVVNHIDTDGRCALSAAAGNGHQEVVEKLLAEGADVNLIPSGSGGPSALMAAAISGHQEIVEKLLAKGAKVDADAKTFGQTALIMAARRGHQEIVKILLAKGANVNFYSRFFGTALAVAAENNHQEVVRELLAAGADVNLDDDMLSNAAENGHQEIVEILLAAGADVNSDDALALSNAAENGHQEIVEILLAAGADVDADAGALEQTALVSAAGNGHREIVEKLLAAGADVDAASRFFNSTALIEAANHGYQEIVEKLLAAGADVNAVDDDNRSALIEAANHGYQEIVEKLLAAGADVNAIDKYNQSALSRAARNGYQEVVEILLTAGADGYRKIVEKLLAAGADINLIDGEGQTALGTAAEKGYQEIVEMLLAAGAKQ